VERGLSDVMRPPNDVLAMGTDRTWADAIHYLRWEEELGKKYEALHGCRTRVGPSAALSPAPGRSTGMDLGPPRHRCAAPLGWKVLE